MASGEAWWAALAAPTTSRHGARHDGGPLPQRSRMVLRDASSEESYEPSEAASLPAQLEDPADRPLLRALLALSRAAASSTADLCAAAEAQLELVFAQEGRRVRRATLFIVDNDGEREAEGGAAQSPGRIVATAIEAAEPPAADVTHRLELPASGSIGQLLAGPPAGGVSAGSHAHHHAAAAAAAAAKHFAKYFKGIERSSSSSPTLKRRMSQLIIATTLFGIL